MSSKNRIKICGFLALIPALVIAGRLFWLQTFRHSEYVHKAESRVYTQTPKDVLRGKILDRNGVVLAESLRTYAVAVSKKNVNDDKLLSKTITETLGVKPTELKKLWRKKGNFFYVKKDVTPQEYEKFEKALSARKLSGAEVEAQYSRIYPFEGIAQDILGATNSKNKGLSGIELMYNEELSAEQKSMRVKRARRSGLIYEKGFDERPETADIYLTIDALGQYYTESIINKYAKKYKVKHAFALVQDSRTGFILAAASYPSKDGLSLPFQFTYEPGSTFKTITVGAALDTGSIKMKDKIGMENNKWSVSGIIIRDHQEKPSLTISEIMEVSSNIGAAKISFDLGAKTMYSYIKKFGFGVKSNVNFLGEPAGILREHTKWQPIDTAKAGYGYTVSVTPVQLASAYSAIADGGVLMQAHLVDKIVTSDGRVNVLAKPMKIRRVVEKDTADKLKILLQNVVKNGTGKPARIKGYSVAGKTGTTEKLTQEGKYERKAHIASFCGFVPASDPRFTILVALDEPQKALFGVVSAAIFAEIAQRFLTLEAVAPDEEKNAS